MHPKKPQSIIALAIAGLVNPDTITVQARRVTPYGKLNIDGDGYTLHHGIASGNQAVHTIKSKLDKTGVKPTITLALGNGGKMTVSTADAEVAFAQLLPRLAEINQGAGTTDTS